MVFDAYAVSVKLTLSDLVSGKLARIIGATERLDLLFSGLIGRVNALSQSGGGLAVLDRNARLTGSALATASKNASALSGSLTMLERGDAPLRGITSSATATGAALGTASQKATALQAHLVSLREVGNLGVVPPMLPPIVPPMLLPPGGGGHQPRTPAGGGVPPAAPPGGLPPTVPPGGHLGGVFNAALVAGTGIAGLRMLHGPVHEAMEWMREAAKLKQMGLGDQQIKEAQDFVKATDVIGTSINQRMKLFAEAQGAFRESGMHASEALDAAKTMTPALAGYQVAIQTLSGEKRQNAESSMLSLNRLVEMMGGLNDSKRAEQIVDLVFRSVQSSGKMISPEQLRQFRAYGGAAVSSISDLSLFAGLEPIIGELKGSTAGMGLRTASNRMQGIIKPPNQMLGEALRLGIWDKEAITFNANGGIKEMKGNPLVKDLQDLLNTAPEKFAARMKEIYASKGIVSQPDISRENSLLFGSNGAKVYDLIMRQLPTIERSEQAFQKSQGIKETNTLQASGPLAVFDRFHKSLSDLGLVVGQVVLPVLIPMVDSLTKFFKWLEVHPKIVAGLTYAFMGLAAAMAIGGTIAAVSFALSGFAVALRVLAVGGGAGLLPLAARGFLGIGTALASINFGAIAAGLGAIGVKLLALLPQGLLVGAAGAVGYGVGSVIHKAIEGTKTSDAIGYAGARVAAFFGSEEARNTLYAQSEGTLYAAQGKAQGWTAMPVLAEGAKRDEVKTASNAARTNYVMAGGNERPLEVTVKSILNGREIASEVVRVMSKDMGKPLAGPTGFDGSLHLAPPAMR